MRLSVAIQHHPARAGLLDRLLGDLPGAEVVSDPQPNGIRVAWRTYREALERTPPRATHRLVVQDDVQVCRNFLPAVERLVELRPSAILALCVCGQPRRAADLIRAADAAGHPWVEYPAAQHWVPTLALVWPASVISPALAWYEERREGWPQRWLADDEIVGRIVRALNLRVLAPVPSLAHHDDCSPSLVGRRAMGGRDPGRVTACYIGVGDPLEREWDAPPNLPSRPLFTRLAT